MLKERAPRASKHLTHWSRIIVEIDEFQGDSKPASQSNVQRGKPAMARAASHLVPQLCGYRLEEEKFSREVNATAVDLNFERARSAASRSTVHFCFLLGLKPAGLLAMYLRMVFSIADLINFSRPSRRVVHAFISVSVGGGGSVGSSVF